MRPGVIRLISVLFLFVMSLVALLQQSLDMFHIIYIPSLTLYEIAVIYSFIREKRLKKDM